MGTFGISFILTLTLSSILAANFRNRDNLNQNQRPNSRQLFSAADNRNKLNRPGPQRASSTPPKVDPIETTQSLLKQGNDTLTLDDPNRDFIILVGNTGSGTTTLTKFLAGDSDLESFWSGDRYLIKDKQGQIGNSNLTLVTKTIFPTLFDNEETQTEFYDLPGFANTKGATFEIPSAILTKKVLDHARRLKIIFVINHSSLKVGESRVDLKNLLDHAIDLIKDTATFHPALALMATKVKIEKDQEVNVIKGMAEFLENVRTKIPEIFGNEEKRLQVENILETLLTKDDDDFYGRLGYLPQPEQGGALTSDLFKRSKISLDKVIDNMDWVDLDTDTDNFGLSLSPSSKYFVRRSRDRLEEQVSDLVQEIGVKVQSHTLQLINEEEHPENILDQLYGNLIFLQNMTAHLEQYPESYEDFFKILKETLTSDLHLETVQSELEKLGQIESYLSFLDQVSTQAQIDIGVPRNSNKKWTIALTKIVRQVNHEIYQVARKLNDQTESLTSQIGSDLYRLYVTKIERVGNKPNLITELDQDVTKLEVMTSTNVTSFNAFTNNTLDTLTNLSVQTTSHLMSKWKFLTQDIDLNLPHGDEKRPSPFKWYDWLHPFETLAQFLRVKSRELTQQQKNELGSALRHDLVNNLTSSRNNFQNDMRDLTFNLARVKKLKEDAQEEMLRKLTVAQSEEWTEYDRKLEEERRAREAEAEERRRRRTTTTTTTTTTTEATTTVLTTTVEPFTTLYSPKVTNWGEWGPWQFCDEGTYVNGFQLKVQPEISGDNSALNGIKLFCSRPRSSTTLKTIKSTEGPWGIWWTTSSCGASNAVGFQLRSEKRGGRGVDNTAANNFKLICDSGWILEGGGQKWGEWTNERRCPNGGYLCGLKTQVEQDQENEDDTGLNNIAVKCCEP